MTSSGSEQKGSYPGKRAGGDTSRTNQADQGARKQETSLMSLVDYQKQGKHTIQGLFRAVADADAQLGALFKTDALSTEYLSQTEFVAHGRVAIKYVETANAYDGYCLSLTQATSYCDSVVEGHHCTIEYAQVALDSHKAALAHVQGSIETSAEKITKKEQEIAQLEAAETDVQLKQETPLKQETEPFSVAGGKKAKGQMARSAQVSQAVAAADPAPDSPGSRPNLKDKLLAELAQMKEEHVAQGEEPLRREDCRAPEGNRECEERHLEG